MSRALQLIRRYAKALLDVAERTGAAEAVRADVAEVQRWRAAAPAFQVFAACDRLGNCATVDVNGNPPPIIARAWMPRIVR